MLFRHALVPFIFRFRVRRLTNWISLQSSTSLGIINTPLRTHVVGVLDDRNFAFDHIFKGVERLCKIVFNGIEPGFCADVQAFGIEEITLRGSDFFQRPIIAADIILGGKLTICVGGVGVDELIAFIDAVLCTCEKSVALRQALFAVTLGYGDIELFEDIVKGLVRNLIPLDCGSLLFGYDIASRSVDFFEGISRADP